MKWLSRRAETEEVFRLFREYKEKLQTLLCNECNYHGEGHEECPKCGCEDVFKSCSNGATETKENK